MGTVSFLQDLAVVLLVSGVVTLLFHKAKQPRVVGYILAGLLIGPHTPPFSFVNDDSTIRTLADLGVVFLMFSLGLDFNIRRLRRVGVTAVVTAVIDVTFMVWLGYELGQFLGWSTIESLFLGGILCDSSTTILSKILNELGHSQNKASQLTIAISVVEDVLAVAMMALLTGVGLSGGVDPGLVMGRVWTLGMFMLLVVVVGLLVVPRVLNYLARFENDELLVVTGVGMCFGVALVAVKLELSMALGAVLVGLLASESQARMRLVTLVEPLRHIFSAVFFVSVGLMLDPSVLLAQWVPVLLATAAVVIGKFTTTSTGALLTGQDAPTAFRVGAGMAQTGEFAFIIAALGISLNATGQNVYQVGVATAVLSTVISPYLIRWMDANAGSLAERRGVRRWTAMFQLYSEWVDRIRLKRQPSAVRAIIRRSVWMTIINTLLIAAILGAAGYAAQREIPGIPENLRRPGLYRAALWLVAMVLAMPLYLVNFRKFNALGMVLAEVGLPMTISGAWARHTRTFIANVVTLAGGAALVVMTFILSASMLPSRETLLLLTAVVVAVAMWGRRRLSRVYQKAQFALDAVLKGDDAGPGADPKPVGGNPASETLAQLRLATVALAASATVASRTLRDLQLRSRTGVSVVGIEREGQQMVNPDPAFPLQPGDRLVMLGSPEQVRAAEVLLESGV